MLFCQEGASLNIESSRGLTPMTAALVSGQDEAAFQLLTPTPGIKV